MTPEEFTQYQILSGQGLYEEIKYVMNQRTWRKGMGSNVYNPTDYARRTEIASIVADQRDRAVDAIENDPQFTFGARVQAYWEREERYTTN